MWKSISLYTRAGLSSEVCMRSQRATVKRTERLSYFLGTWLPDILALPVCQASLSHPVFTSYSDLFWVIPLPHRPHLPHLPHLCLTCFPLTTLGFSCCLLWVFSSLDFLPSSIWHSLRTSTPCPVNTSFQPRCCHQTHPGAASAEDSHFYLSPIESQVQKEFARDHL